jgi:hypothetical protein
MILAFFLLLEPFSWTALFISLALSGASYALNRLLAPKPPTIQRGKLEGELNIQNSQSGTFVPEIFGGDVSELVGDDDDPIIPPPDPTGPVVVVNPGGGNPSVVIGDAFAWYSAEDIALASNSDLNCIYNVNYDLGGSPYVPVEVTPHNANLTRYWPGKGRYFKKLSADVEAGSRYFVGVPPQVPVITDYPEAVVDDFPCFKTNQINGKPAVAFSGNDTYCAQIALSDGTAEPGNLRGAVPHSLSASSRFTIFLVARQSAYSSANGAFVTLTGNEEYVVPPGDRNRVSLSYYGDLDAFGFSLHADNGDVKGVTGVSSWIKDWFLVTAIVSPVGDSIAPRLRRGGVEQVVSTVRAPSGISPTTHNLTDLRAVILGSAFTVKQASKDAFASLNPNVLDFVPTRNLQCDIAEVIVVHTTSEISNTNLALVEAALKAKYGLNS